MIRKGGGGGGEHHENIDMHKVSIDNTIAKRCLVCDFINYICYLHYDQVSVKKIKCPKDFKTSNRLEQHVDLITQVE